MLCLVLSAAGCLDKKVGRVIKPSGDAPICIIAIIKYRSYLFAILWIFVY